MDTIDNTTGEVVFSRPKMPPAIAAAVIAVKKQVRQLGKDEENKFARFKYVSVDKFYEVIGQLMANAGLFVVTDEMSIATEKRETQTEQGQVKASVWITATYELFLFHESGAEYGPIHRTIMVQATGPQAFGSGMSYVEKYFLRSLFKVPTGEDDADAAPQEGVPEGTRRGGATKPPAAPPAAKPATTPKAAGNQTQHPRYADATAGFKTMRARIASAGFVEMLENVLRDEGFDPAAAAGGVPIAGSLAALIKEVAPEQGYEALLKQARARREQLEKAETGFAGTGADGELVP